MNEASLSHIQNKKTTFWWLILSIASIAISGFFSIFLVFLRTPGLVSFFSKDIFKTALIIHVDLSITVWMLTIHCLLNALIFSNWRKNYSIWSLVLAYLGVVLISLAALFGGEPVLSNYVPILNNLVFILGISIFLCGVLISSLFAVAQFVCQLRSNKISFIEVTSFACSIIFILALSCFYFSYKQTAELGMNYDIGHYYEVVFWGFGHVVQFLYIQIMLFTWTMLVNDHFGKHYISLALYKRLALVNVVFCLICPIFYLFGTVDSGQYIEFFTTHMKRFGGVSSAILAVVILFHYLKANIHNLDYKFYSFICSIFVFGIGGAIGYMIHGANVTVPAHYHGSIVGITIALMGLVYYIIAALGYCYKRPGLLSTQLIIYCFGQTLHITALSLSGGYGALRKTAGVDISSIAKLYMGLMGIGGLIAILSGIMFVINCYTSIKSGRIVNESKK